MVYHKELLSHHANIYKVVFGCRNGECEKFICVYWPSSVILFIGIHKKTYKNIAITHYKYDSKIVVLKTAYLSAKKE